MKESAQQPAPAVSPSSQAADLASEQLLQRHRRVLEELFPIPSGPALRSPRKRAVIASVATVVLALGAALWWWDPVLTRSEYHSALAQRRSISLPDRSVITLDASSRLQLLRHLRSWQVQLQQGRAGFDVRHSWWRAFVVDAGALRVRDYGTVFDVEVDADVAEVTLWQGKVAVLQRGQSQWRRLSPGERALASAAGITVQTAGSAAADWRQGKVVCDRTPLLHLLRQLQRYHPTRIELLDPQLGQLQVSGVFDSDKAAEVLELLPAILPLQLSHADDGRVLLSAAER